MSSMSACAARSIIEQDFLLEIFLEIFFVCVAGVIFLDKYEYRIHMPRGFMDDLEGEVVDEKFHEGGLGEDIFSADLDGEEVLLLNIRGDRMHISNKKQEQLSAFF